MSKTAEGILKENGIDIMSLNDDFNCSMLKAMEEYAQQRVSEAVKDRDDIIERYKRSTKALIDGNINALGERVSELEKENGKLKEVIAYADEELSRLKTGKESQLLEKCVQLEQSNKELVEAYQDYINVLNDEINSLIGSAYVHGWRSDNVEKGKACRERIENLTNKK